MERPIVIDQADIIAEKEPLWSKVFGLGLMGLFAAPWVLSGGNIGIGLFFDAAFVVVPLVLLVGGWLALALFQLVIYSAAQAWGAGQRSVAPPPQVAQQIELDALRAQLAEARAHPLVRVTLAKKPWEK